MTRSLGRRLLPAVGLAIAIAVLSALGLASRRYTLDEAEAARWVEHSHVVIETLLRIGYATSTAEASVRGYAVSHGPGELAPGDEALAHAESRFLPARRP